MKICNLNNSLWWWISRENYSSNKPEIIGCIILWNCDPNNSLVSALRYLSLGSGQQTNAQQPSESKPAVDPAAASAALDTRPTSGTAVYEVARPILQNCHAVPTKLKILLDRALSSLNQEEVLMIVTGCGWNLEDYQRGNKLKVGSDHKMRLLFQFNDEKFEGLCLLISLWHQITLWIFKS